MDKKTQDTIEAIEYHLNSTYKVYSHEIEGLPIFNSIYIGGKMRNLDTSKKYLVNKIYYDLPEEFSGIDQIVLRQTIKNFIDKLRKN